MEEKVKLIQEGWCIAFNTWWKYKDEGLDFREMENKLSEALENQLTKIKTMKEIPTAEEFFEQGGTYPELAIAFAKLHVKAAIKAIEEGKGEYCEFYYPLENIK